MEKPLNNFFFNFKNKLPTSVIYSLIVLLVSYSQYTLVSDSVQTYTNIWLSQCSFRVSELKQSE